MLLWLMQVTYPRFRIPPQKNRINKTHLNFDVHILAFSFIFFPTSQRVVVLMELVMQVMVFFPLPTVPSTVSGKGYVFNQYSRNYSTHHKAAQYGHGGLKIRGLDIHYVTNISQDLSFPLSIHMLRSSFLFFWGFYSLSKTTESQQRFQMTANKSYFVER